MNRCTQVRNSRLFGYTYSDFDSLLKKKKKQNPPFVLVLGRAHSITTIIKKKKSGLKNMYMPWIQRNNLFLYFVSKLKLEFIFIFIYLSICRRRNRCDLVRERNKPVRIKFTSIVFGNKRHRNHI
jgi:hypothetical protein